MAVQCIEFHSVYAISSFPIDLQNVVVWGFFSAYNFQQAASVWVKSLCGHMYRLLELQLLDQKLCILKAVLYR